MSISVKDSGGNWVQCAGQGKAEYGASTVRTGTVTFTALENSWNVVEISFDTPMPDDDYLVIFESSNVAYVHVQQVMSKTINGFNAIVWNRDELTSSHPGYIKYTAFKLYTDTEYNKLVGDTGWKNVGNQGVQYRVKGGFCTVTVDISSIITFNSSGNAELNGVIPEDARPTMSIGAPIYMYGYSGDVSWAKTQCVFVVHADGTMSVSGGITNSSIDTIRVTVTYPVG